VIVENRRTDYRYCEACGGPVVDYDLHDQGIHALFHTIPAQCKRIARLEAELKRLGLIEAEVQKFVRQPNLLKHFLKRCAAPPGGPMTHIIIVDMREANEAVVAISSDEDIAQFDNVEEARNMADDHMLCKAFPYWIMDLNTGKCIRG